MKRALGRLVSPADPRDDAFPLQADAAPLRAAASRYWAFSRPALDQGSRPHCVAFAWLAMLLAAPTTAKVSLTTAQLYARAQQLDDLDVGPEDGTTVRGGAKALSRLGLIAGYRWAWQADTVRRFVLTRGPVVVGTDWYAGMTEPGARGVMTLDGALDGGHAYLLNGYSAGRDAFRVLNSWGPSWCENGRAWLPRKTLQTLLERGGEACSAVEAPRA